MFIDLAKNGMVVNDGAHYLNGQAHGGMGEVGGNLNGIRFETGLLRPYFDSKGRRCVTINTGQKKIDPKTRKTVDVVRSVPIANLMAQGIYSPVFNATSLRRDEWVQIDTTVIKAARQRLKAWEDLASANTYGGFDGMSKMTIEYEAMSDPGEAVVDMSGMTPGRNDYPLFKLRSMPLPIIHCDFWFDARKLAASRNGGMPLDQSMPEAAGRRIGEMVEQITIGTVTGVSYGGNTTGRYAHDTGGGLGASSVYGYTNFPHRITKTDLTTPTGSNPEAVAQDVIEMRELAYDAGYYGPFVLYHSTGYDQWLDSDYFRTGGTAVHSTVRDRIKAIDGIQDVRRLDYLTSGYQLILVQMTSDVAQAVNGMDITTLQWESSGGMRINFKVMCIQVPRLRSDYNNATGIVHGTTS
jgi:hypothetical protein